MLSAAMALALGVVSTDASALTFGRLNVQSALGEPLRVEIEVTEITAAEADGMKVNIASSEAFQAAGVAYNAALSDVRANLQRRADGRYVVRLTGARPLNDPFVDLLLEANWSTGRIVRDYTVLLDPPAARKSAAGSSIAPLPPQMAAPVRSAPVAVAPAPAAPRRERPVPVERAAAAESAATVPAGASASEQQVTVRTGDTASKIANAHKTADVSLDQMLVALLRSNPNAFIGGNINRMKAGAVIDVPTATQASSVAPAEARRTVTAQSRDFSEYRRRLAENAPATRVANADRQVSGKLQGNVDDRNAAAASPDKLTISQGTGAALAAEDKVARDRKAQDEKARIAELSKNISDLNKIQAASGSPTGDSPKTPGGTGAAAAPATAAPTPSVTTPAVALPAALTQATPVDAAAPASAVTPAPAASSAEAAAPASASAASAPALDPAAAPAVAAPPKPVVKAAPPPPPAERGFFADLLDNPIMLAGAALIALLIGFLLYRVLGRKRQEAADSVFLESRMPRDSFFGAHGGESVDTKNRGNSAVSSLSYSPSQLDAGDVDPVAEADVYLAYGRDLQAEEILREAMRMNPERTAIQIKLLEIHAKRRDLRAYEALATDLHKLTGGSGNEWNRVIEMGKDLDPGNPLYEAGMRAATPLIADTAAPAVAPNAAAAASVMAASAATALDAVPPPAFVPSVAPLDFDLDLSKPAPLAKAAPVSASLPAASTYVTAAAAASVLRDGPRLPPTMPAVKAESFDRLNDIDLENDFDTAPGPLESVTRAARLEEEHTQPATLRAGLPGDSGFIEFDMSALGALPRALADTEPGRIDALDGEGTESPHAIKLSLARELQALGDAEGARSLVEEVEAESTGDVRAQARQLLSQLS